MININTKDRKIFKIFQPQIKTFSLNECFTISLDYKKYTKAHKCDW